MFCQRSIEVILSCWWTTFCWSIHHSNGKPGIPVECCMEDSFWDDLDLLEAPIDWIGDDKTNTTYSQISGRSINKHPVPVLRPKFFCWVGGEEPVLLDADHVDTSISTACLEKCTYIICWDDKCFEGRQATIIRTRGRHEVSSRLPPGCPPSFSKLSCSFRSQVIC